MKSNSYEQTPVSVHTFPIYISWVKEMDDGELLVGLGHSLSGDVANIGVWRSFNNKTTFSQVQALSNPDTTTTSWGISVVRNEVVFTEYGNFGSDPLTRQSRYVYYSEDSGVTFTKILDLTNPPINMFPNQNGWVDCHLHGACIDPYWGRIWIVTGDGNNSKLLAWTDDKGITWKSVNLYNYTGGNIYNETIQGLSIYPLKDCIIITPDVSKQYMFRIQRRKKDDTPIIERSWKFDNTTAITHLATWFWRWSPSDPLYIGMGRSANVIPTSDSDKHNFILATFDGIKYWKVWEDKDMTIYPDRGVELFKLGNKFVIELENRDTSNQAINSRRIVDHPTWM